jgi:hypothetical protein
VSEFSKDYVANTYPGAVDDRSANSGQRPSFFDFDDPYGTNPMINLKEGWHGFGSLTELAFTSGGSIVGSGTSLQFTSNVSITGSIDVSTFVNVTYIQEGNTYFIAGTNTSYINTLKSSLTSGTIVLGAGTFFVDEAITPQDNITITGSRSSIFEMTSNCSVINGGGSSGDVVTNFNLGPFTVTQDSSDTNENVAINMEYCDHGYIDKIYVHDVREGFLYLTNCDYYNVTENLYYNCGQGFPSTEAEVVNALYIGSLCTNTRVMGNTGYDNGNLIVRGDCESATAPMVEEETTPDNTNVDTYTQATDGSVEVWSATGDGGGSMRIRLVDSGSELHGLVAGLEYTLSADVKVPTGGYTATNVSLFYDDDQTSEVTSSAVTAAGDYESLSLTFTADDDATDLDFGLLVDETGTDDVYWTNIRLLPEGTHNEFDQQMVDNGSGTQESANSWQHAFPA